MKDEQELEKMKCRDLEITYAKKHGIDFSKEDLDLERVFPIDWFSFQNPEKKMEILREAMEKNVLVVDTKGYLDICEGVKEDRNFFTK